MFSENEIGIIRFVRTPDGEAPEEIRKKWIGVEVPCLFLDPDDNHSYGALTGKKVKACPTFVVPQAAAIEKLGEVAPEAAKYWRDQGFPASERDLFGFDVESAQIIKPVMTKREYLTRMMKKAASAYPPSVLN